MTVSNNWSDKYIGRPWTDRENCFYWASRIIEEQTPYNLPLVGGFSFYRRAKVLLKEEKINWKTVTKNFCNFDIVLMRHLGSMVNAHHVGVWTEANGGGVVHAVDNDFIDIDNILELELRGFEIKRIMRHLTVNND